MPCGNTAGRFIKKRSSNFSFVLFLAQPVLLRRLLVGALGKITLYGAQRLRRVVSRNGTGSNLLPIVGRRHDRGQNVGHRTDCTIPPRLTVIVGCLKRIWIAATLTFRVLVVVANEGVPPEPVRVVDRPTRRDVGGLLNELHGANGVGACVDDPVAVLYSERRKLLRLANEVFSPWRIVRILVVLIGDRFLLNDGQMKTAGDDEQTKTDFRKLLKLTGDGSRLVPNGRQDALRFFVFGRVALDRVIGNHAVLYGIDPAAQFTPLVLIDHAVNDVLKLLVDLIEVGGYARREKLREDGRADFLGQRTQQRLPNLSGEGTPGGGGAGRGEVDRHRWRYVNNVRFPDHEVGVDKEQLPKAAPPAYRNSSRRIVEIICGEKRREYPVSVHGLARE